MINLNANLIRRFVMRNNIRITDIYGSVRKNGSEKRTDDSFSLVRSSDETIADVEDNKRMNLS